ncbi:carboxypeptidase-like regulatory domain-containing protein [uncultured Paludibaculum sp.]|uniref:carboxypeptidase-like regulatory domain-containing protein n=1 Tax=uncultured Paludibaculum sp. TaxID=1765020 RepID=UPI002AAC12FB|nr:carboxypeptidase-like regulatory domain-containing protein [uncultured Paludibaculum sp.]
MDRYKIATILLVLAAAPAAAQPERTSSIAGRVVDATTGVPLRRAAVTISMDDRSDVRGMSPTGDDGEFLLRALPPGRFRIQAAKPGYATMCYGASQPDKAGQVVELAPSESKSGLVIGLVPLGAISGSARSADGSAMMRGLVQAYRYDSAREKPAWVAVGRADLDNRGRFRLFGLRPGRYIVRVTPSTLPEFPDSREPGPKVAPAYYPSSVSEADAVALDLGPGAEITGADVSLQPVVPAWISVLVQLPPGIEPAPAGTPASQPKPAPIFTVWITPADSSDGDPTQTFVADSRQWTKSNPLVPGRYVVTGLGIVEGKRYAARQEVNVTGGISQLSLPFRAGVDLKGRVHFVGSPPVDATKMSLMVISAELGSLRVSAGSISPEGLFRLIDVPPGRWSIFSDSIPRNGHYRSMTMGSKDVRRGMLITPETREDLDIVITAGPAPLVGQVEQGVATVVLAAPQGSLAGIQQFYATAPVDKAGHFEFLGLEPVGYKLYAFEELAPQAWLDPWFLKEYESVSVHVQVTEDALPQFKLKAIPRTSPERKGR